MTLIRRQVRSLARDNDSLRDDRLIIVACDDTYAPTQYFSFFKMPRVHVHVISTEDGTSAAKHVLDRLLKFDKEPDDELWMLLDTDHCIRPQHSKEFINAIRRARRNGVNIALSKPCFELWLLLHHIDISAVKSLADAGDAERKLREILGSYNKTKLKSEDFPIGSVAPACEKAGILNEKSGGGYRPKENMSQVYLLWKSILTKSLPNQIPTELRPLTFQMRSTP